MPRKSIDFENQTVTFDFGDEGTSVVNVGELPEDIKIHLMLHGASQKIGDNYAGAKSAAEETGVEPNAWAKGQADATIAQLVAAEWSQRRAGAGGQISDLARAIFEVLVNDGEDTTLENVVATLNEMDKDQKKAYRAHPAVAAVLNRLSLERKEKKQAALEAKVAGATALSAAFGS